MHMHGEWSGGINGVSNRVNLLKRNDKRGSMYPHRVFFTSVNIWKERNETEINWKINK